MINTLASLHKEGGVFFVEFDFVQLHHPVHLLKKTPKNKQQQKKKWKKKGKKAEYDYRKKKERKD